jgi:hypothetical protein
VELEGLYDRNFEVEELTSTFGCPRVGKGADVTQVEASRRLLLLLLLLMLVLLLVL